MEYTNGRMTADGNADLAWKWTNDALDTTTYATSANGTAITNQFVERRPQQEQGCSRQRDLDEPL